MIAEVYISTTAGTNHYTEQLPAQISVYIRLPAVYLQLATWKPSLLPFHSLQCCVVHSHTCESCTLEACLLKNEYMLENV